MDLTSKLQSIVRRIVGLPDDPGAPPVIDRLAFYPARVDAAAANGSTLDVTPLDSRIAPMQGVKLRVGIPGAVAIVQTGALVMVGWDRGDPAAPFCAPSWDAGATTSKTVIPSTMVYLGAEAGSDFVALAQKVLTELNSIASTFNGHTHTVPGTGTTCVNGSPWTGTATTAAPLSNMNPSSVAASLVKAK